jgi:hypothetical protein
VMLFASDTKMKKLLLTGVAALFLTAGTANAAEKAESDDVLAERCMNGATFWCDVLDERRDKEKAAKQYKLTAKDIAEPRPKLIVYLARDQSKYQSNIAAHGARPSGRPSTNAVLALILRLRRHIGRQ